MLSALRTTCNGLPPPSGQHKAPQLPQIVAQQPIQAGQRVVRCATAAVAAICSSGHMLMDPDATSPLWLLGCLASLEAHSSQSFHGAYTKDSPRPPARDRACRPPGDKARP